MGTKRGTTPLLKNPGSERNALTSHPVFVVLLIISGSLIAPYALWMVTDIYSDAVKSGVRDTEARFGRGAALKKFASHLVMSQRCNESLWITICFLVAYIRPVLL